MAESVSQSDAIFNAWTGMLDGGNFQSTIRQTFKLPMNDNYIYKSEYFAMPLSEVQAHIESGKYKYKYWSKDELVTISESDIDTYAKIFSPGTSTQKALTTFIANAKKDSPRHAAAHHLLLKRQFPNNFTYPKQASHVNPYLDIWIWSCHETGFVGPLDQPAYASPSAAKQTHPVLPVLYHHFGCVCPTLEALNLIAHHASSNGASGSVIDLGSGNGYWTYVLRRFAAAQPKSPLVITAVDSMASRYRMTWIQDTIRADGIEYLKKSNGGRNALLLLVYPVTANNFMHKVLAAYKGDTVVVAGTQNANRFTGFADVGTEDGFAREGGWKMWVRVALPSFAGKDDALYVYQRAKS